jgi:hypothetical protein
MGEIPKMADKWRTPENGEICDAADTFNYEVGKNNSDLNIVAGVTKDGNTWKVLIRVTKESEIATARQIAEMYIPSKPLDIWIISENQTAKVVGEKIINAMIVSNN